MLLFVYRIVAKFVCLPFGAEQLCGSLPWIFPLFLSLQTILFTLQIVVNIKILLTYKIPIVAALITHNQNTGFQHVCVIRKR